jgi:hypothetical protein
MIKVQAIDDRQFKVEIDGPPATTHRVSVDPAYYTKLTGNRVSATTLVHKSIEFLLQRESNSSILSSFDLPVISHYYPEYERVIKSMLE